MLVSANATSAQTVGLLHQQRTPRGQGPGNCQVSWEIRVELTSFQAKVEVNLCI